MIRCRQSFSNSTLSTSGNATRDTLSAILAGLCKLYSRKCLYILYVLYCVALTLWRVCSRSCWAGPATLALARNLAGPAFWRDYKKWRSPGYPSDFNYTENCFSIENMDKLTSEEVAIVGAEALKRLTCTVVQEKCTASASVYGSSSNTRPAKKEELHNKVLHSVSSRTARQDEISGVTPVSSGPVFTVSSPSPCGFPCRQFSSSVDSSPPLTASMVFSNAEVVEQCLVTGTESPPNRPNTLSLQREVSTASSTGSGKTTPCNIPGRSSCSHPSAKESLVATYPPRTASCYMSPMQAGSMAASVDRQPQVRSTLLSYSFSKTLRKGLW